MQDRTVLSIVVVLCITLLELFAMMQGLNGTYLSLVVAVLAGLAGVKLSPTIEEWYKKLKR